MLRVQGPTVGIRVCRCELGGLWGLGLRDAQGLETLGIRVVFVLKYV